MDGVGAAVVDEVRGLAALAAALQDGIGDLPMVFDERAMEQMQALDLITQRLAGLADFLEALNGAGLEAALRTVPLADMRARLAGTPAADPVMAGNGHSSLRVSTSCTPPCGSTR